MPPTIIANVGGAPANASLNLIAERTTRYLVAEALHI